MKTKLLLLFLTLVFFNSLLSQEKDQYRLSHKVEPIYQFIHLNLDPDKDVYSGTTKIEMEIAAPLSSFRLHGKNFEIAKISLIQNYKRITCNFEFQEFGLLKITPREALTPGKYKIEFEFNGSFSKKGEGIVKFTKDSLNYIYTQMQDIYARQFFPCFDEPNFKFPYQIKITAPKDYLIVSNTPEEKVTITGHSKTILFKKTKPLPSYLLAFAVGPYETTPIPGLSVPGRIILPKGYLDKSRYGKRVTSKILKSLEEYFGIPYPYEKLDFIGVANYNFGAMENPGLVVYAEDYLIDSDELSLSSKNTIANIIAHELAHMWFGNLVTLEWWNDTWLNEGFATWLADEIVLKEFPELNSMDGLYRNFSWSVQNDVVETITPIVRIIKGKDKPMDAFDALSYSKSQVVLRMLENWMGKDNFRRGLQSYFNKHKWSNTTSDDLFNSMTSVSDKPIKQMMQDFVMQPGVPVVSVQVNGNTIVLSQERLKTVEVQRNFNEKWVIPLNLKIFDGNKVYHKQIVLNQPQKQFIFNDLDTIEWLHLKNNVTGYYLMLLPADIMTKALNSGQLTATEIQDIFTGWRFGWQAGKVHPVDVLKLAHNFRNTQNKAFINGLAGRINGIKDILSWTLSPELFIQYMNQTAVPMLDKIGLEVDLSFTTTESLSQSALINSLDNNPEIIKKVAEFGKQYLLNHTISYNHRTHLTKLFYYYGDDELYNSVLKKIETTKNPSERSALISAIGNFPGKFIQKNLQYALTGDLEPNERMLIPFYMNFMYSAEKVKKGKKPQPDILGWFKKHEDFYRKTVSEVSIDYVLTYCVMDREDIDTFNRSFPEESRSKTMQIKLKKRISRVERWEKLNELYADDVKQYLEDFNNSISSKN